MRRTVAASRSVNLTGAGTYEFPQARVLRGVTVNTGVAAATVALAHMDSQATPIGLVAASDPSVDRAYDVKVRGLSIVVTGTPDITVTFD